MSMRIVMSAEEHSIEIDGTKFNVPFNRDQRDGMRELVVNHFCRLHGFPIMYPNAVEYMKAGS